MCVFGVDKSGLVNSSLPDSKLKKNKNCLIYHNEKMVVLKVDEELST